MQILVLPYRKTTDGKIEFLLLKRRDGDFWQGIAGGGEDDETPIAAARRESFEKASISESAKYWKLDTQSSVPASAFPNAWKKWPEGTFVIPEYYFAVDVSGETISLSNEHSESRWCTFEEGVKLLKFESNKNGLWELNERLMLGPPKRV